VKIRLAVAPPRGTLSTSELIAFGTALEEVGFDGIWLSDLPVVPLLDPVLGLALLAGRTTRLHLGANVVPFGRAPYVWARTLAQLDHLSAGRLLLSFVTGLNQPGERGALGIADSGLKGPLLESALAQIRSIWSGLADELSTEIVTAATPLQDPLEVWLGGRGPKALARVGRIGEGWLGALVAVEEARAAREAIQSAAAAAEREVDPEHFGLSIGYVRTNPSAQQLERITRQRPDIPAERLQPVGREALRDALHGYIEAGLSKFVLRPTDAGERVEAEVEWLAEAVLDLQT
jgi:probable F420-dependent oxidoreductase